MEILSARLATPIAKESFPLAKLLVFVEKDAVPVAWFCVPPIVHEKDPVAEPNLPIDTDESPEAVLLFPNATDLDPDAVFPRHAANEFSPEATDEETLGLSN